MSKHEELIERLRLLADAVKLSPHTEWQLWTSNSWRRFQGVLEPVTQKDGHPDLHAAPGVLEFIEATSPATVTALLDALEAQAREIEGLQAARRAYASEFAPNGEGEPDVGSIHQNIRAMKAENDGLRKDAERYRTLVEVMESAKGSADLQVNDHLCYYDTCEPGEEVSLTWFPDTPVGSYTLHGKTVSEVVDALIDHRSATHG